MPRKTKLTPQIQKAIVDRVRAGSYFSVACRLSGIAEGTGREWLDRGRGTDSKRSRSQLYAAFAEAVERAEAEVEHETARWGISRQTITRARRRLVVDADLSGLGSPNHVTEKFILGISQITGVCATSVALLVLSIIYSQLILRELFYNLSDFSNTLLALL